jgi:hypothetical protein
MSRSFTIENIKKINGSTVRYTGGRFLSETPSASAKKAFTKAYHHLKASGPLTLKISIRETTQNSLHKIYDYKVTKKAAHVEVEINGETIVYNFTTKIKSI